jgi:hypothetical protein
MTPFAAFLEALVDGLPQPIGSAEAGARVTATDVDLALPIEIRIERDGLHASLPRGRMATGFAFPLGRLSARFEVQEPDGGEQRPS